MKMIPQQEVEDLIEYYEGHIRELEYKLNEYEKKDKDEQKKFCVDHLFQMIKLRDLDIEKLHQKIYELQNGKDSANVCR